MKAKHPKRTHAKTIAKTVKASSRRGRKVHRVRASANGTSNGSRSHLTPQVDGVNVNDLVLATEAIKNDPTLAEYVFRAKTKWMGGAHARTKIQGFWGGGREDSSRTRSYSIETDEPPVLLGTNKGPNAVECALSGLGACLAVGIAYGAAARGIKLSALDIELEGGLDIRGFLGISEGGKNRQGGKSLRPGFENVRVVCRMKSDAPASELKELVDYVQSTSPMLDLFRNPVAVAVELEH